MNHIIIQLISANFTLITSMMPKQISVVLSIMGTTIIIFLFLNYILCYKENVYALLNINNDDSNGIILTVKDGGNTGNRIFEYLSVVAISNLYPNKQFIPQIPSSIIQGLKDFQIFSFPNVSNQYLNCKNNITLLKNDSVKILDNLPKATCSVVLDIYSARYEEILKYGIKNIKNYFKFKNKDIIKAQTKLEEIRSNFTIPDNSTVTYVGVHYRGGDYLDMLNTYKKEPSNYTYYSKAMVYFKIKYDFVIFILISADFDWMLDNTPHWSGNLVVNPNKGSNNKIDDLALLSYCNHTIINYGTFGAIAALLNGGTTIVYDLDLPIDYRGATVAIGIAQTLDNWFLLK